MNLWVVQCMYPPILHTFKQRHVLCSFLRHRMDSIIHTCV